MADGWLADSFLDDLNESVNGVLAVSDLGAEALCIDQKYSFVCDSPC
jgi:hypothetical protein